MKIGEINKWWAKGMAKEVARFSNAPKHPKGDKFGVTQEFSTFAPPLKKKRK